MASIIKTKEPCPTIMPGSFISSQQGRLNLVQVKKMSNQHTPPSINSPLVQPKLTVGAVDDKYEREADHVASTIMRMPQHDLSSDSASPILQRKTSNTATIGGIPPSVRETLQSPGQPLDSRTRSYMEPRFGHDFSKVRIHADSKAAESAQAINARAYTVGNDVVFGGGQYAPSTVNGQRLVGHELTHVIQQHGNQQLIQRLVSCGTADDCPPRNSGEIHRSLSSPMVVEDYADRDEVGILITNFAVDDYQVKADLAGNSAWQTFIGNMEIMGNGDWEILGFTDCQGTETHNMSLRQQRAEEISDILPPMLSVMMTRVEAADIGDCVDSNSSESGRNRNRSVLIRLIPAEDVSPAPPPECAFNHAAAAAYARTWALSTNPAYVRFGSDCTNFVSQAMLAGGWTMIGGSFFDRTRDNVWWYGRSRVTQCSYTWSGAQNFANFVAASGRGTRISNEMDLREGDVLQMQSAGVGHIGHSMVVTGKTSDDLLLSYHSVDRLDEPLSAIRTRNVGATFIPWSIC